MKVDVKCFIVDEGARCRHDAGLCKESGCQELCSHCHGTLATWGFWRDNEGDAGCGVANAAARVEIVCGLVFMVAPYLVVRARSKKIAAKCGTGQKLYTKRPVQGKRVER